MSLYDLVEGIKHDIMDYLTEEKAKLEEKVKAGVEITQTFGGYKITIAGHKVEAEHDSSQHRWRFKIERRESEPGPWHRTITFFETSEKKGKEIIRFLQALQEAIKSSKDRRPLNEENLAEDQDEDSLVSAVEDLVILEEDSFGDDGDDLTSR